LKENNKKNHKKIKNKIILLVNNYNRRIYMANSIPVNSMPIQIIKKIDDFFILLLFCKLSYILFH